MIIYKIHNKKINTNLHMNKLFKCSIGLQNRKMTNNKIMKLNKSTKTIKINKKSHKKNKKTYQNRI